MDERTFHPLIIKTKMEYMQLNTDFLFQFQNWSKKAHSIWPSEGHRNCTNLKWTCTFKIKLPCEGLNARTEDTTQSGFISRVYASGVYVKSYKSSPLLALDFWHCLKVTASVFSLFLTFWKMLCCYGVNCGECNNNNGTWGKPYRF